MHYESNNLIKQNISCLFILSTQGIPLHGLNPSLEFLSASQAQLVILSFLRAFPIGFIGEFEVGDLDVVECKPVARGVQTGCSVMPLA